MEIFQEPIHYQNPQLSLKVWNFTNDDHVPDRRPLWHYHKEVEFILVLEGVHQMFTLSRAYTLHPGQVMVIGSSQLHRGEGYPGRLSYIVLHVNFEPYFDSAMMRYARYFMEILEPLEALNYIFEQSDRIRSEAEAIILRIHDEVMRKDKGYEIAVSMHIKHLMLTLFRGDDRNVLTTPEYADAGVLLPVTAYVEEHLASRIDMAEVSRLAGMSYAYFSKYFKSKVGVPFTEYVNRKRIAKAERMLAMGSHSITDIARSVGIENMSHFYEMFKRMAGCTPKQFQAKMRKAEE